jgi:hypothetical protein
MDKLDSHLNQKSQQGLSSSILSAMKLARNKMDRYWKTTDESNIYRIAMGTSNTQPVQSSCNLILLAKCFILG